MDFQMICPGCLEEKGPVATCPFCAYHKDTPSESLLHLSPGTVLQGKYLIGRALGQGGFGITYLALDTALNLKLAVKEYLPQYLVTRSSGRDSVTVYKSAFAEEFSYGLAKFLEEGRMLARFNEHPNIVTVRDFFEANNTAYLVMNYHQGLTLQQYLQERGGKISPEQAAGIFMPLLDALKEVHRAGFLHRDISPDNLLIDTEGRVILIDFGAARQAVSEQSKSLSVIMKAGYSPEEQYRTKGKQGPWSDIYSTATTFYRAITGQTPPESLDRLAEDTLVSPSQLGIAIDAEVERALLKALAVKAVDRYQCVEEFQAALLKAEIGRGSKEKYVGAGEIKAVEQLVDGMKAEEPAVVEKQKWEEQKKRAFKDVPPPAAVAQDVSEKPGAERGKEAPPNGFSFTVGRQALKYAAAVILGGALLIGAISLFGEAGGVADPPGPVVEEETGDPALLNDEDGGQVEPAQEDKQEDEAEEAEPPDALAVIDGLEADYYIDYEQGTIPIGDLPIGARVVDPSWEWEYRLGLNYSDEDWRGYPTPPGEAKPVTWIVVAKDHYEGLEPHVTLLAEDLIGLYTFDDSTDRGSQHGSNHWGESGTTNAKHGLRPWLNSTGIHFGEGFYRAFSEDFKQAALNTPVPNHEWEEGKAYITRDKVFIPSLMELIPDLDEVDFDWIYLTNETYEYFSEMRYMNELGYEERAAFIHGEAWNELFKLYLFDFFIFNLEYTGEDIESMMEKVGGEDIKYYESFVMENFITCDYEMERFNNNDWFYWTRIPLPFKHYRNSYFVNGIVFGAFGGALANFDSFGVRPALNLKSEILVSEINP